jgi:hypothetical protein
MFGGDERHWEIPFWQCAFDFNPGSISNLAVWGSIAVAKRLEVRGQQGIVALASAKVGTFFITAGFSESYKWLVAGSFGFWAELPLRSS